MLVELGDAPSALIELEQAASILAKPGDLQGPPSNAGFRLLEAEHWLGKAHLVHASSTKLPVAQRSEHCVAARSWFQKSLPGFESLRDKRSDYNAAATLEDIGRDLLSWRI
jgi:hypothetical protein